MSAAAARRRKQLAARKDEQDAVAAQLNKLLLDAARDDSPMEEAVAYEALQLAQSSVRKRVHAGDFQGACDLAYTCSLALLKKSRVSVASQIMTVLADVLRETHAEDNETWLDRIEELNSTHATVMEGQTGVEATRLLRLQRDWLLRIVQWSSDLGSVRFGNNRIQAMLGDLCWKLGQLDLEAEEIMDMRCDAVQHMSLAEKPDRILSWLKALPAPTDDETASGHECPPGIRDALLTRAILLLTAVENLRDANALLRGYIVEVEERDIKLLAASYTNKDDGKAPSHVLFASMLLRICEKDTRTGPLYSWLLRSFKRELDRLYKPQVAVGYTSKIGNIYFNIQPPPNMLNMVENMMNMMGGGGMGGPGGGGGMNPAMMQAMMAQMQQAGMM